MPRIPEKKTFQITVIASGKQFPPIEGECTDALEAVGRMIFKLSSQLTGHTSLEIKVKRKEPQ